MDTNNKIDCRDIQQMENSFLNASYILKRDYLNYLTSYDVDDFPNSLEDKDIKEFSAFYELTQLVYNKNENLIDKLTTVANTVYIGGGTLVTILSSDGINTHFQIGVVNKKKKKGLTTALATALGGSITGNFNGSKISPIDGSDVLTPLEQFCDNSDIPVISAVSNIPSERKDSNRDDMQHYIQGIEKLVDSLSGQKYCILTIADAVEGDQCSIVKNSLEQLYSQLSGFESTEMSMNENSSVSNSKSYTNSFTETIGTNTSVSYSHTNSTGWSETASDSKSNSKNIGAVAVAAAGIAAVGLTVATGGLAAVAAGGIAAAGSAAGVTALAGSAGITAAGHTIGGLIGTKTKTHTDSTTKNNNESDTKTEQNGRHEDKSKSNSVANTMQETYGNGKSLSFTVHNRTVKTVLDTIDEQIKRLNECGNSGAFSSCTYIITSDTETNLQVSSFFNALISGENTYLQTNKVNSWGIDETEEYGDEQLCISENKVKNIVKYLKCFTHPLFRADETNQFTAATLVSGKELALQLCFPKKSIDGLTVYESAEFGRNIIKIEKNNIEQKDENPISIGNIYHMHSEENHEVKLAVNDLSSHTFITGSTGTGKSNIIYQLIYQLTDNLQSEKIKALIIEPAKGEYKNIIGKNCQVYGTNPKVTKLLRINPFSFPSEIHVLEHIDRLIEILNACWPMYAAMPAVLKDAVERAYEKRGWNLLTSECTSPKQEFPTFLDVLDTLPSVLEESLYSTDTKGDYSGALVTRIRSLTNGINGLVFCAEKELRDEELFERNVIVDISRVGSSETKALLMGILIMKLQEYRMNGGGINEPLKHVTVLEEAHNLLKKTSFNQTQDNSNLQGKSVEMITNSIAEMRTYGEGFIIADQAPDLLDESTIRNTNTKIVLRLPDENDRKLVGKAIALSDEQIDELARLPRGVAAVYQNDWLEAVLCAFNKFEKKEPYINLEANQYLVPLKNQLYRKALSDSKSDELRREDKELLSAWIDSLSFKETTKSLLRKALNNLILTEEERRILAYNLFNGSSLFKLIKNNESIEKGHEEIKEILRHKLRELTGSNHQTNEQTELLQSDEEFIDTIEQEILRQLVMFDASRETTERYIL